VSISLRKRRERKKNKRRSLLASPKRECQKRTLREKRGEGRGLLLPMLSEEGRKKEPTSYRGRTEDPEKEKSRLPSVLLEEKKRR